MIIPKLSGTEVVGELRVWAGAKIFRLGKAPMRRYDFTQMEALIAVADSGGYAAAGRRFNSSASSFSQKVSALEAQIGVRLFARSGRKITLTTEGERLVMAIAPALVQCGEALRGVRQASGSLEGTIRMCLDPMASDYVRPRITRFLDRYQGIKVDLSVSDLPLDVVENRFDFGLRPWQEIPRGMRAKHVTSVNRVVVASPAFLARRRIPLTPNDLDPRDCLPMERGGRIQNWPFRKGTSEYSLHPAGQLVSNNRLILLDAALLGLGFVYVESFYVERLKRAGKLVPVLADWMPPGTALFGFSASGSRSPGIVQLLLNELTEEFRACPPAKAFKRA
jgi:DNA-binding transcriptional LysR family regulator